MAGSVGFVPRFEPFNAIRYASGVNWDEVIAPPYDVLSEDDVRELGQTSKYNITWIDVPRGDDDRYKVAAYLLQEWLAKAILVREAEPSFTIYRMSHVDATGTARTISGVLGGLEVVDEGAGGVLPHERTTKKASTDRLDLTVATAANLSPVWGLSLASGLTAALAEPGLPLGEMVAEGVTHRAERVTDPHRIARISRIIGRDDVLIADGHHRYSVSRTYRDMVRKATKRTDTAADHQPGQRTQILQLLQHGSLFVLLVSNPQNTPHPQTANQFQKASSGKDERPPRMRDELLNILGLQPEERTNRNHRADNHADS